MCGTHFMVYEESENEFTLIISEKTCLPYKLIVNSCQEIYCRIFNGKNKCTYIQKHASATVAKMLSQNQCFIVRHTSEADWFRNLISFALIH